jgi:hypothetical protein
MVKYMRMKFAAIVLFALCSASALAAARVVVPSLPEAVRPDAEVSTNIALNVNAARTRTATAICRWTSPLLSSRLFPSSLQSRRRRQTA